MILSEVQETQQGAEGELVATLLFGNDRGDGEVALARQLVASGGAESSEPIPSTG